MGYKTLVPNNHVELSLTTRGYSCIAGIDEVGRGTLAGPVLAAAVILPLNLENSLRSEIRDSKLLSSNQREKLGPIIQEVASGWSIGTASAKVIDNVGIVPATHLAMLAALTSLPHIPDFLLVDGLNNGDFPVPNRSIVHGDKLCLSIAAASIVAKITRDRMMHDLDREHPGYDFAKHKGYATKSHLGHLRELGPSSIHRMSFKPVRDVLMERMFT